MIICHYANRPFSKMAPTEGGLESGDMEYLQDGGKHGGRNATEREIHYRYFGLRKQLARKPKREREKGTSTTWKRTVKAKSYRSMRKTEAPHSLRLYLIADKLAQRLPLSVHVKLEQENAST